MRIFNATVVPDPTVPLAFLVSWCCDVPASCVVRYGPSDNSQPIVTSETLNVATSFGTTTLSALLAGIEYRVQIIAMASSGGAVASTNWLYCYPTTEIAVQPEATQTVVTVVPKNTVLGDQLAGQFPPWMTLAQTPGTVRVAATNLANSAQLLFTEQVTGLTPGMIATCESDATGTLYHISDAPTILSVMTTAITNRTLTVTPAQQLATVPLLANAWMSDHPSDTYLVVALTPATAQVTLDRIPTNCNAGVTWCFETMGVTLDYPITNANTQVAWWQFDTVGRRLLEAIARPIQQWEDMQGQRQCMFSPRRLDQTMAWFGHMAQIPATANSALASTAQPITTPLSVARTSAVLAAVNADTAAIALPMLATDNLYDFLTVPAPTYYLDGTTLLLHNLTMVEEVISADTGTDPNSITYVLSYPVQLAQESQAPTCYAEQALYVLDPIYGWRALSSTEYSLTPDYVHNTTIVTHNVTADTLPYHIRYHATPFWDEPYASVVNLAINGVLLPAPPRPHLLWNQFDELSILLGVRRQHLEPSQTGTIPVWALSTTTSYQAGAVVSHNGILYQAQCLHTPSAVTEPGVRASDGTQGWTLYWTQLPLDFESNTRFRNRLVAATMLDPTPTVQNAIGWLATQLDHVTWLSWDMQEPLVLPAQTTLVLVPALPQTHYRVHVPMLQDNDATLMRWYLPHATDAPVTLYFDGVAVDRPLTTDPTNPMGGVFVTMTPAEWAAGVQVTASYSLALWRTTTANGYLTTVTVGDSELVQSVDVFAFQDIAMTTFADPTFRALLLDPYGIANQTYRNYAASLLDYAHLITDRALWGQTPWFTHADVQDTPQLTRLPYGWS